MPLSLGLAFRRARLLSLMIMMVLGSAAAQEPRRLADTVADETATELRAEQLTGRPDREVLLEGNVDITRGNTAIDADRVKYDIIDEQVDAVGNVLVRKAGSRFEGKELRLKLDTGVGYMDSLVYKLLQRNAQGRAARIDFESEDQATISSGYYTTCNGPDPDWYLRTSKLTLDEGAGIGYARNAVLIFKGVPVAGAPRISFPLTDERVSGFLAPTIASSTSSGLQVTTPYFWNIAPNRDVTFFPRYIAQRGLMLGADVRYLEREFAGETRFEFINDTKLPGETRYGFSSRHNQVLAPGLTLATDLNGASDDFYARDFPLSHVWARPGVNRRLLTQSIALNYGASDWNGAVRLIDYQVLQDPNALITVPYARLPQVNVNNFHYSDSGLDLTLNSEYTRFVHPTLVQGDRLVLNPRITYNQLRGPGYFIRPSLSLHGTLYNLDQSAASMTAPARVLPTLSLDSGLIFEREATFFNREAIQTLEPRAFYTYTPYKEQTSVLYPRFDTSEADLNYAQIFRENRFVGNDRVGDSNQLTLALISRFLETTGAERLRLAVAQRINLKDPTVSLGITDKAAAEDILLLMSGRVTDELRLDANLQYDQTNRDINRMNAGVFWQAGPMKVVNAQYRRDSRNIPGYPYTNYELIDLSGQWPLSRRWYGVGRINYLLDDQRMGQSLLGVEYLADCWIFRVVGQRIPTAAGLATTHLFMQLEFSGLATLGSSPMKALRSSVPGYQPLQQPQ
ncbi:MAG: LPS-assembly protein LptD [Oxalobacteraceae bacterium]|nr:LPS-assembly protein LptD [Oxalobacteraceae bacterium]